MLIKKQNFGILTDMRVDQEPTVILLYYIADDLLIKY